jgi:hypothetical protein
VTTGGDRRNTTAPTISPLRRTHRTTRSTGPGSRVIPRNLVVSPVRVRRIATHARVAHSTLHPQAAASPRQACVSIGARPTPAADDERATRVAPPALLQSRTEARARLPRFGSSGRHRRRRPRRRSRSQNPGPPPHHPPIGGTRGGHNCKRAPHRITRRSPIAPPYGPTRGMYSACPSASESPDLQALPMPEEGLEPPTRGL